MCTARYVPLTLVVFAAAASAQTDGRAPAAGGDLSSALTRAKAADGAYISWREHVVDDEALSGVELRSTDPRHAFEPARTVDSPELPLPTAD